MRTFAIGDIHGNLKALLQCFERSKFDYQSDRLICLGDITDGYPETPQVLEELLKLKNLILVWGNHDVWLHDWLNYGTKQPIWVEQGGRAAIEAYLKDAENNEKPLMIKHRDFFKQARYYYEEDNKLFVHGGIPQDVMFTVIEKADKEDLIWDRDLAELALANKLKGKKYQGREYDEIYLGHTATNKYSIEPIMCEGVILLDQGAGWAGKLSIMDINTKEFWQSDMAQDLYPNH